MKKMIKKGFGVAMVYLIAVVCTLLISNRVNELDSNKDFRNDNASITIKLSR